MHDNLMYPHQKTVVITGGTKGIGLDMTLAFHNAGYKVFVGARSQPSGSKFLQCNFLTTDVTLEANVEALSLMHLMQQVA